MKYIGILLLALTLVLLPTISPAAGDRDTLVREDRSEFSDDESWFYNDLDAAAEAAKAAGKPMFVVLRCIP